MNVGKDVAGHIIAFFEYDSCQVLYHKKIRSSSLNLFRIPVKNNGVVYLAAVACAVSYVAFALISTFAVIYRRGGPYVVVPVSRGRLSQDDTPFPAPAAQLPAPSQPTPSPANMSHVIANPSVTQTLDEMDFERGLWYPAMQGDLAQIDKILAKGVDVNSTDKSGYTPLHYAVRTGDIAVVQKLLIAGANVNMKTKAGQATPLHRAAAAGHTDVVKLLLDHGAEKVPLDSDGRTPLHRSAEAGHEGVSLLLLRTTPHAANVRDTKGLLAADVARGSLGTIIRDNSITDGADPAKSATPVSKSSSKGRTKSVSPVRTAAAASIASPVSSKKISPSSPPKSRSNSPKKS
ncbi:hypothetical protein GE061_009474 [Apolygus lucorum]|uniref:Ankyrin repeat domain-containing protein 39 n=1 Tax=Apolygus lucorum TaxID=248454 RepID=A0A8S9Y2D2_APOLU|nr:hypothetical protein GE061_009474 [Apolygus lucorum]